MLPISVPSNSSRYFETSIEALSQPIAKLKIEVHKEFGYLYNSEFNPDLISYDSAYTTVNPFQLSDSTAEINKLLPKLKSKLIIDIGCGQGEFVDYLHTVGQKAIGFDPVCRVVRKDLKQEIFNPLIHTFHDFDTDGIVFVMRCVLPHISNPWEYIDQILEKWPAAQIIVQHQRIEYFAKNNMWNSLMHDHVNIFALADFTERYSIHKSSIFADGEWQQIFFGKSSERSKIKKSDNLSIVKGLLLTRDLQLSKLATEPPFYIFGAAGKGVNFAYAGNEFGLKIKGAIDDSPLITGKFLEGSGVKVLSSVDEEALEENDFLIVMNHSHLNNVRHSFPNFKRIESLLTLARKFSV